MESILTSIKKLLGIEEEYEQYDTDIIIHINTVLMRLRQLGIGPSEGFRIEDKLTVWDDLLSEKDDYEAVKTYVYMKVKLIFDPPLSSAVIESMKAMIAEFEWCLNVEAESTETE